MVLAWKDLEGGNVEGQTTANQIIDSSCFKDVNMFEEEGEEMYGDDMHGNLLTMSFCRHDAIICILAVIRKLLVSF